MKIRSLEMCVHDLNTTTQKESILTNSAPGYSFPHFLEPSLERLEIALVRILVQSFRGAWTRGVRTSLQKQRFGGRGLRQAGGELPVENFVLTPD